MDAPPSIAPGSGYLGLLAGLVAVLIGTHALLRRRIGPDRLHLWTGRFEGAVFCVVLALMIGLSGVQILLRNLFHTGLLWIDPLTRTLVLWLAFLGALAATSRGRHLHIDVVQRALPKEQAVLTRRILSVGAALVCALMSNGAYEYILQEKEAGTHGFLGIPSWLAQSILFWGFGLLSYRFVIQAIWPTAEEAHA
ncbi:MAG: TRAP transporter small permease subunit [Candidatus Eisenbacteria bacterium]|nr:TRAP transporter small permease subunit [Candidatus Eisenbacteria bacterium]MCC7141482.1 TRAP transporter small permease subunit [Candidatus Eisenbacteria bacterium]